MTMDGDTTTDNAAMQNYNQCNNVGADGLASSNIAAYNNPKYYHYTNSYIDTTLPIPSVPHNAYSQVTNHDDNSIRAERIGVNHGCKQASGLQNGTLQTGYAYIAQESEAHVDVDDYDTGYDYCNAGNSIRVVAQEAPSTLPAAESGNAYILNDSDILSHGCDYDEGDGNDIDDAAEDCASYDEGAGAEDVHNEYIVNDQNNHDDDIENIIEDDRLSEYMNPDTQETKTVNGNNVYSCDHVEHGEDSQNDRSSLTAHTVSHFAGVNTISNPYIQSVNSLRNTYSGASLRTERASVADSDSDSDSPPARVRREYHVAPVTAAASTAQAQRRERAARRVAEAEEARKHREMEAFSAAARAEAAVLSQLNSSAYATHSLPRGVERMMVRYKYDTQTAVTATDSWSPSRVRSGDKLRAAAAAAAARASAARAEVATNSSTSVKANVEPRSVSPAAKTTDDTVNLGASIATTGATSAASGQWGRDGWETGLAGRMEQITQQRQFISHHHHDAHNPPV